jgi:hypothetical protein
MQSMNFLNLFNKIQRNINASNTGITAIFPLMSFKNNRAFVHAVNRMKCQLFILFFWDYLRIAFYAQFKSADLRIGLSNAKLNCFSNIWSFPMRICVLRALCPLREHSAL